MWQWTGVNINQTYPFLASTSASNHSDNHAWQHAQTLGSPFNTSPGASNVRIDMNCRKSFTDSIMFYNDATFSDVTILMLGQRPVPSNKSVTPVYTFHAHNVVLSAGSRVFANYFYTNPKV